MPPTLWRWSPEPMEEVAGFARGDHLPEIIWETRRVRMGSGCKWARIYQRRRPNRVWPVPFATLIPARANALEAGRRSRLPSVRRRGGQPRRRREKEDLGGCQRRSRWMPAKVPRMSEDAQISFECAREEIPSRTGVIRSISKELA